jgi:two-component system, LytTR family, response regulator LytT
MKILIIEDEQPAAKQLTKMLQKADPSVSIIETIDSVEASVKWLNTFPSPDAIFMDIQIADGLSFDIFNHVNITSPVVFTTAFDQYAIKAFKVNAIDYLLKPIDEEELADVLSKIREKRMQLSSSVPPLQGSPFGQYSTDFLKEIAQSLSKTRDFKTRFLIKQGQNIGFVDTQEIAYFFSEEGLTQFYIFQNKKHIIEHTLDELESLINPKDFFRINRKIIVSVKCIQKISTHFNGRLKLELTPNYANTVPKDSYGEGGIFVARERVSDFKTWLGG